MSQLHVRQIKTAIERRFAGLIDLSDVGKRPENEREDALLSRGQCALALAHLCNVTDAAAANSITDGFGDNGIDAVLYAGQEGVVYLAQSKWRRDGTGSIDRGEIQKFVKGCKDLVNARWPAFNEKVRARAAEIEEALNDATTRIAVVVVYTGAQGLSAEVEQDIKDFIEEQNDSSELMSWHVLKQAELHSIVSGSTRGTPVNLDIALSNWCPVREPYKAYFGQIAASDVAKWRAEYAQRLFGPNLRVFLGSTVVNDGIVDSLLHMPESFWYLNNGITALCGSIEKKPIGGDSRDMGYFECKDLTIVNGAQTVGSIASAMDRDPAATARGRVSIRLISLSECPADFARIVTRCNNTQNKIDARDFVALDEQQERIREELLVDEVEYVYKSGENVKSTDRGFDLTEATVARACLNSDVSLAVHAKGAIGRLWDNIDAAPYRILFNNGVSGPRLWRLVRIVRVVDRALHAKRTAGEGRRRLLAVHGNRLCIHAVLNKLPASFLQSDLALNTGESAEITRRAKTAFELMFAVVEELYPDSYPASLVKTLGKSKALMAEYNKRYLEPSIVKPKRTARSKKQAKAKR